MAKEIFPDKIKISSVRLLSGSIECPQDFAITNPIVGTCATNFVTDFRVNPTNKNVIYFLTVKLDALDERQSPMPIKAEYSFEIVYVIDNLQDYIIRQSPVEIIIENILANTLMAITYSTVRGMIISRTEGTILRGVILPVVNPNSLIIHKITKQVVE